MQHHGSRNGRRGITVLTLLLLIIALVIVAVFLTRYLRSRPAVTFRAERGIYGMTFQSSLIRFPISSAV